MQNDPVMLAINKVEDRKSTVEVIALSVDEEAQFSDAFSEETAIEEISFHVFARPQRNVISTQLVKRVMFDTAATSSMSSDPARIKVSEKSPAPTMSISGFNSSTAPVAAVGENDDGVRELLVPDMPSDLVLLSAHAYTKLGGATILYPEGGSVCLLNDDENAEVREFMGKFKVLKNLIVENRTYRVVEEAMASEALSPADVNDDATLSDPVDEEAHSSTATRFFNSKIWMWYH